MVVPNATTLEIRCDTSASSGQSEYESWLHTPPSLEMSQSQSQSRSHWHSATMTPVHASHDLDVRTATPLCIHVRKTRVLLFASLFLALLLVLVVVLAHGVALATLEGTRTETQQRALLDHYNFYSGTVAALVAKPFEICASALLPVLLLVFATKLCLHDDSLWSKAAMMALQALLVTTLTSAFSSLYVQPRRPQISPIVVSADLVSSSAASRVPPSYLRTDPFQRRATSDTVLSTAMQSPFVKSAKNPCAINGERHQATATHSFALHPWLQDMLPHGVEPARSLQITVGDLVRDASPPTAATITAAALPAQQLPISMANATNLLLHLMFTSETLMPWLPSSFMENSTFDKFLWRVATLNAATDHVAFLGAAAHMVNESLHRQATWLNYSASEATLNFSRFELSRDITFESVTIDIPFEEKLMTRTLRVDEQHGGLKYVDDPTRISQNRTGNAVYDVATAYDCGVDACLVKDPLANIDWVVRSGKRGAEPQIQVFAPCDFGGGSENVTVAYLHGRACSQQLNTSMMVYSIGKRIEADEMVLDPPAKVSKERTGHLVNVRRFHTITMGRLTWQTHDIANHFKAACAVEQSSGGCRGLSYQLEGNASRYLIIGERHLPLSALGPFMGVRSQWTPLVTVSSSIAGKSDLLYTRNVKRNVNWTMDASCSDSIETLARQVDANRWYIEYGLQEAYTAALFFLFQNAALREERVRLDATRTLDFVGSRVTVTLEAKIPLQSALAAVGGSAVLMLAAVLVALGGKRAERSLRDGLDAHRVAKVLLVDQSFPKFFLKCTVDDPRWHARGTQPLECFRIQSLSLKALTSRRMGDVESSAAAASATHHNTVIHLPPQPQQAS